MAIKLEGFDQPGFKGQISAMPTRPVTPAPKQGGNFLTHLFPTIGGIAGGAGGGALGGALAGSAVLPGVGTAVGGLLGALLGGGAGGAAGKLAENKVEHQNLGHDVLRQGLEQGALSAGPIRLLKGGTAALAARGTGAGLLDALKTGGEVATSPSLIKTALSNKLGDASQNLTSKALGLTKGQKNDILGKTGQTAGAIAQKYGIKQASDVPKVTKPMYNEFNGIVNKIPGTFSKDQVGQAFKSAYQPMLAKGTPTGQQKIGSALKDEANNLLKGISGKGISASELNTKRQAFDKLAYKAKGTDPAAYDINKQSRDVLANLVHSAAEGSGLKTADGKTLKQLGSEINKVERLGKAANKNIEGAGGHTALGLGGVPGAIVGAPAGPAGVMAGIAVNKALNSTAGRVLTSKAADKAAQSVSKSAVKGAANPFGLTSIAKRSAPAGLLGALAGAATPQSLNNASMSANPMTMNTTNPTNANMDTLSQTSDQTSSNSPFDPANIETNIEKMVAGGASMKDISAYVSLASSINSLQSSAAKSGAPQTIKPTGQQYGLAQGGLNALQQLSQLIQQDPSVIEKNATPGQGLPLVGSLVTNAAGAGNYHPLADNILQSLIHLQTGATATPEEVKAARGQLPAPGDSAEVQQRKLNNLAAMFAPYVQGGQLGGNSSLASALGGAQ